MFVTFTPYFRINNCKIIFNLLRPATEIEKLVKINKSGKTKTKEKERKRIEQ